MKRLLSLTAIVLFCFSSGVSGQCLPGDLDNNCRVDLEDLVLFTEQWLDPPGCSGQDCADLVGADGVNLHDFQVLSDSWQRRRIALVINELMAANAGTVADPDAPTTEYDDWVEIYNNGPVAVDLGGLYVTDYLGDPTRHMIPTGEPETTTLEPGEYLLLWADGQTEQGVLHLPFSLRRAGEEFGLFDEMGEPIDAVTFGTLLDDESYGRVTDGSSIWRTFNLTNTGPTPGTANGQAGIAGKVILTEIMYHPLDEADPLTEDIRQEYVELYNAGGSPVHMDGWRFASGVEFTFSEVVLQPGEYLVVAADVASFQAKYPELTDATVVGGWTGRLSNSSNNLRLEDAFGNTIEELRYSDEGEWASRYLGPVDRSHRGWMWSDEHDGGGRSLELVNPAMPRTIGSNWAASAVVHGTPGAANSVLASETAPLIAAVEQTPVLPTSSDSVTVTAEVYDEAETGLSVTLYYRQDASDYSLNDYPQDDPNSFTAVPMEHVESFVWSGSIEPHADETILEYYIEAVDTQGHRRTYPAPAIVDGEPRQVTNLLCQVLDEYDAYAAATAGSRPYYYMVMTRAEQQRLAAIGSNSSYRESDAQMNAAFISVDSTDVKVRQNVGVRNRGHGTRSGPPNNYRVKFPNDRPWKGVDKILLNCRTPHLQQIGTTLHALAGLPAPQSQSVLVRINGHDMAMDTSRTTMYGAFVHHEAYDSDWAERLFPEDSGGNAYKCVSSGWNADLDYHSSEDPQDYRADGYTKETNDSVNDWSDLIELTRVLETASEPNFLEEVGRVVNVEQWMRWLALQAILSNQETNLSRGRGDDYAMYRGIVDPRFVLLPWDLDTILGQGEADFNASVTSGLWRATELPAVRRLMTHPQIAPRYYYHLQNLLDTLFEEERFARLLDEIWLDHMPQQVKDTTREFIRQRKQFILDRINRDLTIETSGLSDQAGFATTNSPILTGESLYGTADVVETRAVRVQGQLAAWQPVYGSPANNVCRWWLDTAQVSLAPGINRILVETYADAEGQGPVLASDVIDVWYDDGGESTLAGGTLAADTVLDAASGPWNVTGVVTVPSGVTLAIEPGTTVFFDDGAGITVQAGGRIAAEGAAYQRIRMTRRPGTGDTWRGVSIADSLEDNRLCFIDHEYGDGQGRSVSVVDAALYMDGVTFAGTDRELLRVDHPRAIIRNTVFPTIGGSEPVHGVGLSGDEYIVFDGCTWGSPSGYNDIIDFTGASRPGPIFEVYDSTFLGGSDDGPDLDNTDAHIEGCLFMNFHQGHGGDSTSNAVATGDGSEVCIARNVFVDNDHCILHKEDVYTWVQNNVFIGTDIAVVSFGEPYRNPPRTPGRGTFMDSNLFVDNAAMFEHFFDVPVGYGPTGEVGVYRSMLPADWHTLGDGNLDADPQLVGPYESLRLKSTSPALGRGANGLDMGAMVRAGASIDGAPGPITWRTDATLTVGGPGIVAYKWRLVDNGAAGPWSGELALPIDATDYPADPQNILGRIELSGLEDGHTYRVDVLGRNSAGRWQGGTLGPNGQMAFPGDPDGNSSREWTVDTAWRRLVINEVLARNAGCVELQGTRPNLVELYYDAPTGETLSLSGMSLSDDSSHRFLFPADAEIAAGEHLVLYADANDMLPGIHLGFALDGENGDAVFLYDSAFNLLDGVRFGPQIPNLSVGRVGYEQHFQLCEPTFGSTNLAMATGDPAQVRINEWLAAPAVAFVDDFIELYNPQTLPVDVSGMTLTDNPVGLPDRSRFGPLSFLAAKGFLALTADGSTGGGHVDFHLDADTGMIALFDAQGGLVDRVWYGMQARDISMGRKPDGAEEIDFFRLPTPGLANPAVTTAEPEVFELIGGDGELLWKVPTDATEEGQWMLATYEPLGWADGNTSRMGFGQGYEAQPLLAYNDCANTVARANVTDYTIYSGAERDGFLVDFNTGLESEVYADFSMFRSLQYSSSSGDNPQADSDAYSLFHDDAGWIVDFSDGIVYYASSPDWWCEVAFSGLDPAARYTFATTACRGNASYDNREAVFTILDHASAVNTSSDGVVEKTADATTMITGNNTAGYVVSWDQIAPSPEGTFRIRAEASEFARSSADGKAYPFGGFMLECDTAGISALEEQMLGANAAVWLRIPFAVEDPAAFDRLLLQVKCRDGFVAWLNGTEAARANFTGQPLYNSPADGAMDGSAEFVEFDLTPLLPLLHAGENVLALQAMNDAAADPDFMIEPRLIAVDDPQVDADATANLIRILDDLRLTELMYHPADAETPEFVELRNVGQEPLDLTGLRFTAGIRFTFPACTLEPGAWIVVTADPDLFTARYGQDIPHLGPFTGSLDNAGESIVLRLPEPHQAAVLRFTYDDAWYPATDGAGYSLEVREPASAVDLSSAQVWRASLLAGGSPGDEVGQIIWGPIP